MKRVIYVILCAFVVTLVSCSKKAENVQDLQAKYKDKSFSTCETYFASYEEILNVYLATIDKAVAGDEKAMSDIEEFEPFFSSLTENSEKIAVECPEKLDEFNKVVEQKLQEYFPKLMQIAEQKNPVEEVVLEADSTIVEGDTTIVDEVVSEETVISEKK